MGLPDVIRSIKELAKMKIEYDERISGMTTEEMIVETVRALISQRFGRDVRLEEFRSSIKEALKSARITEFHEKKIMTGLMKDLFRELKGDIKELARFAEEITRSYVMEKLRREGHDEKGDCEVCSQ